MTGDEAIAIEPGDYINMKSWFGDVWAEVLHTLPGTVCIRIALYNKGGTERWTETLFLADYISKVIKKADAPTSVALKYASVRYSASEYHGGFDRHATWPTPLTAQSPFHSRCRERHPTLTA